MDWESEADNGPGPSTNSPPIYIAQTINRPVVATITARRQRDRIVLPPELMGNFVDQPHDTTKQVGSHMLTYRFLSQNSWNAALRLDHHDRCLLGREPSTGERALFTPPPLQTLTRERSQTRA